MPPLCGCRSDAAGEMAAMLVCISDGSRHAVVLPYVLGRRDAGPIPSSANRVSRTAACVHAGADGALSIRSTHDAPVAVVRAGRLHQVWKGALLQLADGDVVVAEAYNLMKALGVARDTAPENTCVDGVDLAQYHACRLELGAGLAAAQPAAQHVSHSTPAFTPALARPARSVTAASQPSLVAQLEQARAEAARACAEVVQLVLESLVAQVAQQPRGIDRGSGDGTVLATTDRGSGDGTVLASVHRGRIPVDSTAPPGPTALSPRKRTVDSKQAGASPSKRSKPAAALELIGSACGTVLSVSRRRAAELSATHATLHRGAELWTEDVPEDRIAAKHLARDLQAAVDREALHVLDITAAVSKVTAEVSVLLAPTKSLDSQATASLKEQQVQAKARLATMRSKLKLAQENSAPLLAQMKKEAKDKLTAALDKAREPIKPDDWHCSECCCFDEDDYGGGYYDRRRGYGYGRECPGYDCSGTECDCWMEDAETELDLSGIISTVKNLLLPVGLRGAPGSDLVSRNWEAAISRVRAVVAGLQDWADESDLVEDAQFKTICKLVGETWQSVAVWVDESVITDYGLASELQELVDEDGDSFVVQAGSVETHMLALKLVQVPWSSPALRSVLSGASAPVRSVEPPQVSVIRMQRLFSERRYTEALALSKHAKSNYYAAKAMIKLGASFEDLEKHVTATCKNFPSSSLEALAKFVDDDESSALKKYLLLGYAVLQRSAAPTKANVVGAMFLEFLRAAMRLQPTGSAVSLPSSSVGSSALFESSLAMLRGHVGDASPPMAATVAAVMICTIANSHGELTTLVTKARAMGNTHPREMFVVLRKLVQLQQKPVSGHARLYGAKPQVDLEKLCLMVEFAVASTDDTLKQEAQRLATDVDTSADPLCMVKVYGKLGDEDTAVVFARRIYATKHQLRPAQLSELIDFMLSAGQVNALLADVKSGSGAGTIAEKLTRHLRETGTNMQALADLCLYNLRNNKVIEDESAVKLADDAVQAAMKVGAAAVSTAVSTICELVKASFKPKSAANMPYHQRSRVVERNQANLILNGKKKVEDALKKIRPTQEGLLKIAGQLVEHQLLAARLVKAADECGSVSGVEMMKQVFQKNLTSMPCRINHGSWQTLCQSCLRAYGPAVEATAAACYGCGSSGPVVLQILNQYRSALKRPVWTVLRGIPAQVQQSPIAALSAPVFAGFVQEPVDVANFCKSSSASAVPVGTTVPDGASASDVGKWVSALLGELLGPAVCERLHQVCVEEQLDASVLLSMSIEDITEVFEFENSVEEIIAVKLVLLGIQQKLQQEQHHTIAWDEWWNQHGYGSVFPTALGHLNSGVLCALSDEELHAFATQVFRENCVGLEGALRALRNTVQHSPQSVVSAVSQQRKPFTIVVIGGTGAGKSTCLNSLLGEVQILPTNCMRACTATIIEMTHLASANAGERYVAKINFVTKDEWAQELKMLCYTIAKAKAEAPAESKATDWLIGAANHAVIKLRSIYGSGMEDQILSADLSSLQTCEKVNHLLENGAVRLGADTAGELSQKLETMGLDSDNDTSDGATWPLTKTVNVQGPWPLLQQGVRLVDAPGLHDDNSARASVVKGYLAKADSIFFVSNIKRAVNDKTTKDLLTLDLRRNLLATGKLGQLAFICTQSDEVSPTQQSL
eukprot:COSAG02_NODE_1551_length_11961_cov_19.841173_4_plen_1660_part_00